jgi:hypothetical protein
MQFSNVPRRRMEVWSKRIHFPVYLTTTSSNQPARPARSAARIPAENQRLTAREAQLPPTAGEEFL